MTSIDDDPRRPRNLDDPTMANPNSPYQDPYVERAGSGSWVWVAGIVGVLVILGLVIWGSGEGDGDLTARNTGPPAASAPATTGSAPAPGTTGSAPRPSAPR